jgi:heptosyltransferase-2
MSPRGRNGSAERILVIKTHAIGDLLMTTPALRDLRQGFPLAHITLMTGTWSAPALRFNPHIDEILEVDDAVFLGSPARNAVALARLLLRLRRGGFSKAFIFHPMPAIHLFARLAGIPVRYGLLNTRGSRHLTDGVPEDLGPDTYYPVNFQRVVGRSGAPSGPPTLEVHPGPDDAAIVDRLLQESGVGIGTDFILVAPGGGRNVKEDVASRRWPVDKFAELVRETLAAHPGLTAVLTGARGDAAECAAVAGAVPGTVDLTARTTLPQLFALAARARAVVCNDSSLLHIATACGTPAVVPFGPTGARQRVPEVGMPYAVQSTLPCSPCYVGGRFPGCSIGHACLKEMPVELLRDRLTAALARPTLPGG